MRLWIAAAMIKVFTRDGDAWNKAAPTRGVGAQVYQEC
jgi:hypothetical protein